MKSPSKNTKLILELTAGQVFKVHDTLRCALWWWEEFVAAGHELPGDKTRRREIIETIHKFEKAMMRSKRKRDKK